MATVTDETAMRIASCENQRDRVACELAVNEYEEAAPRSTFCVCGEAVSNLEGHLLAHHPDAAARGVCPECGGVAQVGHFSSGAALAEHLAYGESQGTPCPGSGRPPHRHLISR